VDVLGKDASQMVVREVHQIIVSFGGSSLFFVGSQLIDLPNKG
jgi:hypothetical protein